MKEVMRILNNNYYQTIIKNEIYRILCNCDFSIEVIIKYLGITEEEYCVYKSKKPLINDEIDLTNREKHKLRNEAYRLAYLKREEMVREESIISEKISKKD